MVLRCLLDTHVCSVLYLIFVRGVLFPLLKHSRTNSHDLVGLSISQKKVLSWILASRPSVSCLGPKPQPGRTQSQESKYYQQFHFWSLQLLNSFFMLQYVFCLVTHQTFFKAVWHLLGRDSHPPHPSVLLFCFGTAILCFPVQKFFNWVPELKPRQCQSLCLPYKHQLTLSKSKSVNKGNHEPESL